jgi:hypothetical protein
MVTRVSSKRTSPLVEKSKEAHVFGRSFILNGTPKTHVTSRVSKTTTFKDHACN